ncbi:MAG: transposase domain-containing protein [Planctomycetes bacterium]|nr:transposase domain-containing protein [Planctomycetota bacterium]
MIVLKAFSQFVLAETIHRVLTQANRCSQRIRRLPAAAVVWWVVATGRENRIFVGSDDGGATAAVLLTLIATCQRHKADLFVYLCDALTRFAATPIQEIDQFLPGRWV